MWSAIPSSSVPSSEQNSTTLMEVCVCYFLPSLLLLEMLLLTSLLQQEFENALLNQLNSKCFIFMTVFFTCVLLFQDSAGMLQLCELLDAYQSWKQVEKVFWTWMVGLIHFFFK